MTNILRVGGILLLVVLFAFGCTPGRGKMVIVEPGAPTVQLKASNFIFEPNDVKARQGDVLTIRVENISGTTHNLTVKNPQGNVLANVDIPPKGTATAKVTLTETGTYPFYCDKTMHAPMGMRGKIDVSAK
jgi:plastocyanin